MIAQFTSPPENARERGRRFGEEHRSLIARSLEFYHSLFNERAGASFDTRELGFQAVCAVGEYAPELAEEIQGMAEGAALGVAEIGALNARTEILGRFATATYGECSTIVVLRGEGRPPISVQTWDWHEEVAETWLVWTIEFPDGRSLQTLTEYGILGKIGVNRSGVGLHLNALHHRNDGSVMGVPVHVIARSVLDSSRNITQALTRIGLARAGASSALTVVAVEGRESTAMTAEINPEGFRLVTPGVDGVIIQTNHFLSPSLSESDTGFVVGPDSFVRRETLLRQMSGLAVDSEEDLVRVMASHLGGEGAVCCHPDPASPFGYRFASLATISLDLVNTSLRVRRGGPCGTVGDWWSGRLD